LDTSQSFTLSLYRFSSSVPDRIRNFLNMTVATPHGRIGNDRRTKRRQMERMDPVAEETNDGNVDTENLHLNINNHPIDPTDQPSDEDDTNGMLDHEIMDEPALVETTTNDDHPIGAFANGDDGEDDGEDKGIVDGNTTTDSTSKVSNVDIYLLWELIQSKLILLVHGMSRLAAVPSRRTKQRCGYHQKLFDQTPSRPRALE
jgi:hypothetical protein